MTLHIVRLLDHLGIARAHIVGYSLGAHLTSHLLTLHPERFLSATLIAGYGPFDWSSIAARQADTVANELEQHCISRSLMLRLASPAARPTEDSLRQFEARCFADSTVDRLALAAGNLFLGRSGDDGGRDSSGRRADRSNCRERRSHAAGAGDTGQASAQCKTRRC